MKNFQGHKLVWFWTRQIFDYEDCFTIFLRSLRISGKWLCI